MADNTTLPGTGDVYASDDISGVKFPRVKLIHGADGTNAGDVSSANPLPVEVITGGDGSVQGVDAHDAAITADPVLSGGYASAAAPTNVSADGDAVRSWYLRNGAQCVNVTAAGALIPGDATNGLDVDVTRMPGTVVEDAASAGAETSVLIAAVRRDTASSGVGADGDFANLCVDSSGRLHVNVGAALPAGTNNIGDVDVLTLPGIAGTAATDAAVSGNPVYVAGRASAAAPTDVSADGDVVPAWRLRNGAAASVLTAAGALIGGDATNGLDVDVTRVIPGTSATHLGKAEDAAAADGDTGVAVLAVRRDAASSGVGADGDYANLSVDSTGALRVTGSVSGTQYAEDAASAGAENLTLAGAVRQDTISSNTSANGDYTYLKTTAEGRLYTDSMAAGAAAHDAAVAGNPVLVGLEARTTNGTPVTSGDAVRAMADTLGKQVVVIGAPQDLVTRGLTNYTTNSAADVIAAAGAGVKIVVMGILVVNGHATVGTKVTIRDGTTSRVTGYAGALGGGFCIASTTPVFIGTANTAVTAICGTTGADVDVTIWGYLINQ
jgi:hypothetical protein